MPTISLEVMVVSSAEASDPVPVPTSRIRSPFLTPANAMYFGASRRLHRPMKRSYSALIENIFASASVILASSCVAAIAF